MRIITALAALAFALSWPTAAHAWGPLGHRLVARLAESRLDPATRAEVERLLATEGLQSLADVANWADNLRELDPDLGRRTSRWHYVNLGELGCRYDADAACPGGHCVVEAISAQAAILGDRSRSDAERLQALKFVVHFVGDVHQPMHGGNARDRGGNNVQVNLHGKGTNLHALWDSGLLRSARLDEERYLQRLQEAENGPPATAQDTSTPAQWAEQSCAIAVEAYPPRATITDAYLAQHRPVAERQVQIAGERLSALLGTVLARAPATEIPDAD
ncbi:S1/P1 nuclease [Luteimonas sp. J16]|jgi:hypothetical protein|uniref:S1/P1 nuclease n=1 Tax=unclassified Luteimonas TaxID=2629088 RepID=UPI0004B0DD1A|nr:MULTISPECIES: S1/P1 nuclease [unclassified Luteimonas]TWG94328.1 S1/P1 nuclease [Luteimonas sp. J16]